MYFVVVEFLKRASPLRAVNTSTKESNLVALAVDILKYSSPGQRKDRFKEPNKNERKQRWVENVFAVGLGGY